jgi:hypothetical protein
VCGGNAKKRRPLRNKAAGIVSVLRIMLLARIISANFEHVTKFESEVFLHFLGFFLERWE